MLDINLDQFNGSLGTPDPPLPPVEALQPSTNKGKNEVLGLKARSIDV